MSSIDAAIIKALVEHIGGNPDEIPDGPIGGSGSSTLSFRYEPLNVGYEKSVANNSLYVNKILPTMFVIGHTALRLKCKNSDVIETYRSEERRVGKECSVRCRSRWSPSH